MLPTAPTSRNTPTVFVVDDDNDVRESLELLVHHAGWRSESFAPAREFLGYPRPLGPSCLVLDVSIPNLDDLDLQKRIASDRVDMPIIVITGYADVRMAVEVMKAGAFEFLMKPVSNDVLLNAIRRALERSSTALGHEGAIQALQQRYALLSRREREVMMLVCAGRPNKQVAFQLGISEITVKAHRGKVMRKMQADSFADLVNMAARLVAGPRQSVSASSMPSSQHAAA
jgi:FixJ family two-component response regulator